MKNLKKTAMIATAMFCSIALIIPAFGQGTPKLSDAEIASVAVTANQIDIDYAQIAIKKSKDPKVIEFANTMAKDHKAVIDMAVELVTKLKVTPKDNAVSKEYSANAKKTMAMLNTKSGKDFDKAYVDNEVAYHKAVIEAVKTVLIPQSQNEELKALLQKAVPIFEAHLKHAEMVQMQIK